MKWEITRKKPNPMHKMSEFLIWFWVVAFYVDWNPKKTVIQKQISDRELN